MPQMSPMLWMLLFMYFALIYMVFLTLIYFFKNYFMSDILGELKMKIMGFNFKW
uniref:ATP synthase F0 subunit 8 n=1 Tax=Anagyrus jenniferae TaxID=2058195 RepID=UPI002E77863F|nr:ATP synthase F0 subunit 8 [Anagyrus jenniferae]WPT46945.1 ATP synthase F0 subunit 8 [Anagyrus jenniferae]